MKTHSAAASSSQFSVAQSTAWTSIRRSLASSRSRAAAIRTYRSTVSSVTYGMRRAIARTKRTDDSWPRVSMMTAITPLATRNAPTIAAVV